MPRWIPHALTHKLGVWPQTWVLATVAILNLNFLVYTATGGLLSRCSLA